MRESLLTFIRAAQEEARSGETLRGDFILSLGGITPQLRFGYGYHEVGKVLVFLPQGGQKEMSAEEAVDLLLNTKRG